MSGEDPKMPAPATETATEDPIEGEEAAPDSRDDAVSNLLKRSLGSAMEPPRAPVVETILLKNVQKKIRKRSRGRFYADGWSTSAQRVSYVTIALMMLLVLALAYFALGPTSIQ